MPFSMRTALYCRLDYFGRTDVDAIFFRADSLLVLHSLAANLGGIFVGNEITSHDR
jgi:hypothetical protein